MGDNVKTVGQRLSDNGIACGYKGKWHLDGSDYFGNGRCPDGWDSDYWYDMKTNQKKHYVNSEIKEYLGSYYNSFKALENIKNANCIQDVYKRQMLEDAGMGASLQHYNPLIDDEVRKAWNLPGDWKLVAQMPFGVPVAQPVSYTHLKMFGNSTKMNSSSFMLQV